MLLSSVALALILAVAEGRSPRIIGGEPASILDHPYQVALEYAGKHACGGVAISPEWIVTAGHCITEAASRRGELTVRAGTSRKEQGGSVHRVAERIRHASYRPVSGMILYDIGVLRVEPPLKIDAARRPVPLFESNEAIAVGSQATVTGWGRTEYGVFSDDLLKVSVPVVRNDVCSVHYGHALHEGHLCAGLYDVGDKDSCEGDSGGPLIVDGRLAGIVSSGNGCGDPHFMGMYTNVAVFREWIRANTGV